MGIINITPDSFSGDGLLNSELSIKDKYKIAENSGIEFLDIGCFSTRPKYKKITTKEEIERFDFFLKNINYKFKFSIDSTNIDVIEKAIQAGFLVINDVSGLKDKKIIKKAKSSEVGLIVVHRNPFSKDIHEIKEYKNVVDEVKYQLDETIESLISEGINESQIAIDPGLGFGKKIEDSAKLLLEIKKLCDEFPLIVGYSKKQFRKLIPLSDDDLLNFCFDSGVSLVRLHLDNWN